MECPKTFLARLSASDKKNISKCFPHIFPPLAPGASLYRERRPLGRCSLIKSPGLFLGCKREPFCYICLFWSDLVILDLVNVEG